MAVDPALRMPFHTDIPRRKYNKKHNNQSKRALSQETTLLLRKID